MARAGNQIPGPAAEHHIFSVHTAVPSKGTADFFYSTYFCLFPNKNTKEYKRIQYFHHGCACHCAGALFLRFGTRVSFALQESCTAIPVLKLFNQISRLEEIKVKIKYEFADGTVSEVEVEESIGEVIIEDGDTAEEEHGAEP